jgi:hypothetical protein
MTRLFRISVALIASYGVALQLLLLGFALASHTGFDDLTVICSSDGWGGGHSDRDTRSLPLGGYTCASCPLACATAVGAILAGAKSFSILLIGSQQRLAFRPELGPAQSRHQPQEARGPPLG